MLHHWEYFLALEADLAATSAGNIRELRQGRLSQPGLRMPSLVSTEIFELRLRLRDLFGRRLRPLVQLDATLLPSVVAWPVIQCAYPGLDA